MAIRPLPNHPPNGAWSAAMAIVEAVLALIAACVGFALLARWLRLPYAVILVLGGMVLAFVPGAPEVQLDPHLALAFFLPPLLQASAYRTDWRAFRGNLGAILFLAVGAVLFTALCVAAVARLLVPDMSWTAAIALGAIVAPPDAVAAGAVLSRLRLPRRIVVVLEGESLVNDATALVLYRAAVASVALGTVEWGPGEMLAVAAAGAAIGVALGWLAVEAIARLRDTLLETVLSFIVCYVAFLTAEAVHASGVMAVVATGMMLGRAQHRRFSPETRLAARTVWEFVDFVLNSLVFILIGLQLNAILDRLGGWSVAALAGIALAVSLTLIVSRFLWVFPASWLPRLLPAVRRRSPMPPWAHVTVVSWAGMRGVVSLAAALALPNDFPQRDLIVFLAFTAILATLVLQGTTLEWLIRRLGVELPGRPGMPPEEAAARHAVARATLAELESRLDDPLEGAIARDLVGEYRDIARVFDGARSGATAAEMRARLQLRLAALRAGRARLLDHHRTDGLEEELLVGIGRELDLEEERLRRLLHSGLHR
jgi:CPA1 family monovalent cation:H+ antiporter